MKRYDEQEIANMCRIITCYYIEIYKASPIFKPNKTQLLKCIQDMRTIPEDIRDRLSVSIISGDNNTLNSLEEMCNKLP